MFECHKLLWENDRKMVKYLAVSEKCCNFAAVIGSPQVIKWEQSAIL